ncbi:hypothetical protein PanWU01x14_229870 [Parasponia andersonii]|uniref:Uncharacterized protein n=1 Tax=Parasponia andersonii TaxID=3476 RepID=A0A2P5BL09_PARAD|nr:hypothetical protein PanWU01x14_229870 [Parasponia andersonii]
MGKDEGEKPIEEKNTKDNSLKEASLISHEDSIIHPFDVEAKKGLEDTNVVEVLQSSSNCDPPIKVIEPFTILLQPPQAIQEGF